MSNTSSARAAAGCVTRSFVRAEKLLRRATCAAVDRIVRSASQSSPSRPNRYDAGLETLEGRRLMAITGELVMEAIRTASMSPSPSTIPSGYSGEFDFNQIGWAEDKSKFSVVIAAAGMTASGAAGGHWGTTVTSRMKVEGDFDVRYAYPEKEREAWVQGDYYGYGLQYQGTVIGFARGRDATVTVSAEVDPYDVTNSTDVDPQYSPYYDSIGSAGIYFYEFGLCYVCPPGAGGLNFGSGTTTIAADTSGGFDDPTLADDAGVGSGNSSSGPGGQRPGTQIPRLKLFVNDILSPESDGYYTSAPYSGAGGTVDSEWLYKDLNSNGVADEGEYFTSSLYGISLGDGKAEVAVRTGPGDEDFASKSVDLTEDGSESGRFSKSSSSSANRSLIASASGDYAWLNDEFKYVGPDGREYYFWTFDSRLDQSIRGRLKRIVEPDGRTVAMKWSADSNGVPSGYVSGATWVDGKGNNYESFINYVSGTEYGFVSSIEYRRNGVAVRSAEYGYVPGLGPLSSVIVRNGALPTSSTAGGPVIDQQYYRYYNGGPLELALTGDQYAKALNYYGSAAAVASAPSWTTDSNNNVVPGLVRFADHYYEYSFGRVTRQIMQQSGAGCVVCGVSGLGEYNYAYQASASAAGGENAWRMRTTETLPDGSVNLYYTNSNGQIVLQDHRAAGATSAGTVTWNRYHEGNLVMSASAAAVSGYSESYADLVNYDPATGAATYLYANKGRIDVNARIVDAASNIGGRFDDEYYLDVVENAGVTRGKISATYVQNGTNRASAVMLHAWTYVTHDLAAFVATDTDYSAGDGDDPAVTEYVYSDWYESGGYETQYGRRQVKLPVVNSTQNGADSSTASGSSTTYSTEEVFDANGNVVWSRDADGHLDYFEYDLLTGARTLEIRDVDTTGSGFATSLKPAAWTNTSGLHLRSEWEVDAFGRTVAAIDPNGRKSYTVYDDSPYDGSPRITRVYRDWNDSTHLPATPVEVTIELPGTGIVDRVRYSWSGSSGLPIDANGRPTGAEAWSDADLTLQSLARDHVNESGQIVQSDAFADFGSVKYAPGSSTFDASVSEGTHYLATRYRYDAGGRRFSTQSPDGTIRMQIHDDLGRVLSEWSGTDSTGSRGDNPTGTGYTNTGNNMVRTASYAYDANGNLIESRAYFGDGSSDYYATRYQYDARDRLIGKAGPDSTGERYTLDNAGRQTAVERFANVTINTDGTLNFGTVVSGVNAKLRGKVVYAYDDQGRVYRTTTYEVNPSTGAVQDGLSQSTWYDLRGNAVKTASANGLFQKTQFDGVGRMVSAYVSFDAAETSWADALTVAGDTVVSQRDVVYVGDRQAIASTLDRTAASGSATGRLTPGNARLNASVTWYDAAGRVVGTGAYGTDPDARVLNSNGTLKDANSDGVPDAYAAGVPTSNTSSGTLFVILAKTAYDAAGRVLSSTDNKGQVTQYRYDLLGRRTAMIENYVDGVASETENATDRTTEWHYDPWGRLVFLRALNPLGAGQGVQLQDTQYFYGSDVDRSWVTHTVYPDAKAAVDLDWDASGKAVLDSGVDLIIDTYDRLGRKTISTDQRGVVHTYNYDAAGRLGSDVVTSLGRSGENVDGAVRAIGHTYDDVGRRQTVTSYANTAMTSVANQVKLTYDGWGNVIQSQQAHSGAVTGTTPAVSYTFDDGASGGVAKYVRLSKVTYPNARELFYLYGGSDTANDKLNRVYEIGGDASDTNSTYDARFFYAGTGTLVREARASGTSKLDYDPSANGSLSGFDRFGRVVDQTWSRYTGSAWAATDATQYAYDANSNRTSRISSTNGAGIGDPNAYRQSYTYDGLDRLTGSVDAKPNGGGTAWADQNGQSWNGLDALGNWRTSGTDTNGDGVDDVTQTRSHNAANEITSVAGSNWTDPTYDAAGNMTRLPPASGSTDAYQKVSYDAWNRQVGVVGYTSGNVATTTTVNKFDGVGRRTSGNAGEAYFDEGWRELELRSASTGSTTEQNVWDPRYVDALISRDVVGGTATAATTAGTLDTSFDSDGKVTLNIDATDYGRRVAIQSDGKILVAGRTGANGSTMDFAVVRYNTDGSLDSTWGTSGIARTPIGSNDEAFSLALLSSGKVMVVGSSDGTIGLVRYNSNGTLDTSFDGDGKKQVSLGTTSYARNIVVDANGKLVIAGQYGSNGSSSQGFVIRINADGTSDSTWNSGSGAVLLGSQNVRGFYGLTLDANGKIVVSGQGSVSNDHFNFAVARLNTNGTLDTTFNSTGVNVIQLNVGGGDGSYDVAVQSDGKIVAAGYSGTSFSPYTNGFAMVRLTTSGTLDSTFGSGGKVSNSTFASGSSDSAFGLSIQSDGTIVLAGSSAGDFGLARYTSAGSLDTSFGTAGTGRVKTDFGGADGSYAVARDAAGRFVLAGFTDADMALARYHGVTQAATSGTQRQWVQQDANFNVTSVAGDDGAVLERYRYTPYGERTVLNAAGTATLAGNASAIGNPFGHQGGRFDAASGAPAFNSGGLGREYASNLGRWTSNDRLGFIEGSNRTQYVRSNPALRVDPAGLASFSTIVVAKSYIATIYDGGWTFLEGFYPSNLLRAGIMVGANVNFRENPLSSQYNDDSRLFSRLNIEWECDCARKGAISKPKSNALQIGGLEGGVLESVTSSAGILFKKVGENRYDYTWTLYGRPNMIAEGPMSWPAILEGNIKGRSAVWIWHTIKGSISCNENGKGFVSASLAGSAFPSHRLWVNGVLKVTIPQGPFSSLWKANPAGTAIVP